jgi:hypothetical protein
LIWAATWFGATDIYDITCEYALVSGTLNLNTLKLGEIAAGETGTEEGVFAEDGTPIVIRTALLQWVPTAGALVTAAGRKLRVMRVRSVDGDAAITLECEADVK